MENIQTNYNKLDNQKLYLKAYEQAVANMNFEDVDNLLNIEKEERLKDNNENGKRKTKRLG